MVRESELRFFVCPRLDTQYTLFIGMFEYQIYKYQFSVLCWRKELELRSTGHRVGERERRKTEEEYATLRTKADELLKHIRECLAEDEYVEDRTEINDLYEQILLKVHPALNDYHNENRNDILQQAEKAYRKGRKYLLKSLAELADGFIIRDYDRETDDEIVFEARNSLREKCAELEKKVSEMENSYPYTQKDFLSDEGRVRERQNTLNRKVYDLKEEAEYYYRKLGELNG